MKTGRNKSRSFGARRPDPKPKPIRTVFQRPDALIQPLDVMVTVFNSARYRSRWKHYEDFVSLCDAAGDAVRLWTVEIAFGERDFAVTDARNEQHLQLRTSHELWHKERSLNLLAARVVARHPRAQYFAFVDPDITFLRHDWADECRHRLQHYDVIQMWQDAYDLDPNGRILQTHRSFVSCFEEKGPPTATAIDGGHYTAGVSDYGQRRGVVYYHPGYCWGWRRRAFEDVGGLIDWSVLGSADFHMAHGLVGTMKLTLRRKLERRYTHAMLEWEKRAKAIRNHKGVGCMGGTIVHHWHGSKADRRYKDRWKILEETKFDHYTDLVADAQGLYRFQHQGKRHEQLRDLTRQYFHQRNEDA
jgi:hypothetical protein